MRSVVLSVAYSLVLSLSRAQDTRFEVEFLAHAVSADSPGHAWVCLYKGPVVGPPARSCVGFFVKGEARELFALLSAKDRPSVIRMSAGDDGRVATIAYRGVVSKEGHSAIQEVISQWQGRGYNIKWSNCADFVEGVAMAAGFEVPNHPGVKYPTTYLRRLGEANPTKLRAVKPGS